MGTTKYGFTRDFQTFFAIVIFGTLYMFMFHAMKNDKTAHSDNILLRILVVSYAWTMVQTGLVHFGSIGFNPLISTISVIFTVSQTEGTASPYAHYLWAYIIAPMVASFLAAILHLLHVKGSSKTDGDNYE